MGYGTENGVDYWKVPEPVEIGRCCCSFELVTTKREMCFLMFFVVNKKLETQKEKKND